MNKKWCMVLVGLLGIVLVLSSGARHPQVKIITELGDITLEIYQKAAPITAKNFLKYVELGLFDNNRFFRTVTMDNQPKDKIKIEVVQAIGVPSEKHFPAIVHETTKQTGILHKDGAISMARAKPGTASSSFFICVGDQPQLDFGGMRNPDGQGFAAFGKVIQGMAVVRKILKSPCKGQQLTPAIKIRRVLIVK